MGWQVIERIDRCDPPTLVWKDGQPRDWSPVTQICRKDGIDRPVLTRMLDGAFAMPVKPFEEREAHPLVDLELPTKVGNKRVVVHHVVAPNDEAIGLLVWIGFPTEPLEPRPRTAGMMWAVDLRQTYSSKDTVMLRSNSTDKSGSAVDADQFFHRVLRFPQMAEIVDMCNDEKGDRAEPVFCTVTLLHDDLRLVNVRIATKRRGQFVFGVGVDISQWEAAQVDPLTAMRVTGLSPSDQSRAVLAFRGSGSGGPPGIVWWVTDPPAWIAFWGTNRPSHEQPGDFLSGLPAQRKGKLIYKDDFDALIAAREDLDSGRVTEVTLPVRLQGADGSWVKTSATLSNHPDRARLLYIIDIAAEPTDT
jgi:hypothetical protein